MAQQVDEETPLRPFVRVNDDIYPPVYYNACREIFGGIFQLLIIYPLMLALCVVISPVLIYWVFQIYFKLDARGVQNGQSPACAPRVEEEPDESTHIGRIKILFVIPDGGYCPAEVSIMYNTLKSYKKYETDEVRIIFATPSGSIDAMNVNDGSGLNNNEKNKKNKNKNKNNNNENSGTTVEVYAYGCDPLFKSPFGFGLFYAPFIDTYYREMLESVDWYNSRFKNKPSVAYKEVISFEEIETEDVTELYDGIYIAGGHHWNYNKLYKDRMLHYKLSKLWQLSLDNQSGLNDPIQFCAIGRGVAVLAYALYTHSIDDDEKEENDLISKEKSISITLSNNNEDMKDMGDEEDEEQVRKEMEMRQASRYDSDTDSNEDDIPSMLPSASSNTQNDIRVPNSPKTGPSHSISFASGKKRKKNEKISKKAKEKIRQSQISQLKRQQSPLFSSAVAKGLGKGSIDTRAGNTAEREQLRKNLRSILYHVQVTTLPVWCEFLGNLMAWLQYGQIFSAANPHMQSCAEIVESAVGDTDASLAMMEEKKFYHKGPQNWLVWFFQSAFDYCTKGDFRLTYVIEDSHLITGRWFIDANLAAKRFMAKMAED